MPLPTTLVPHDAARRISMVGTDLDRMADRGAASAWVSDRARAWLSHRNDDVGLPGFYPFDALAAAYVAWPDLFDCAETNARIGRDRAQDWLYRQIFGESALLAGPDQDEAAPGETRSRIVYCADVDPALHARMMLLLARDSAGQAEPAEP